MDSTTLSCKSFIMRILNFVAAPVTIQPMCGSVPQITPWHWLLPLSMHTAARARRHCGIAKATIPHRHMNCSFPSLVPGGCGSRSMTSTGVAYIRAVTVPV